MKLGYKKWIAAATVLALGLLAWTVVEWVRAASEPPQIVTLPDGTKYRFGGVTWGTNQLPPFLADRLVHHLPAALSSWVRNKYGTKLRLVWVRHTIEPELRVWMDEMPSPPGQRSSGSPRAFLADENGVEAGSSHTYISGNYPRESAGFTFVPRRSRMLEARFYQDSARSSETLSKVGSVRFRNPVYGKYPQWQPEPLPAIKMAGDLQVTLTNCWIWDRWQGRSHETCFGMDFKQPPATNVSWTVQQIEVCDATGNRSSRDFYFSDGGRECSVPARFWPDEQAIRLKVWLKRTAGFSLNESITVTNVPLPVANATNGVTITNQVGGYSVLIQNYAKPLLQPTGGMMGSATMVSVASTGSVPWPYKICMAMEDLPADMLAEIESVKTDSGELLHDYQSGRKSNGEWRDYQSFPSNALFLNITISVQKLRTVEFLVKPPKAK
jgi:hypothetical protein